MKNTFLGGPTCRTSETFAVQMATAMKTCIALKWALEGNRALRMEEIGEAMAIIDSYQSDMPTGERAEIMLNMSEKAMHILIPRSLPITYGKRTYGGEEWYGVWPVENVEQWSKDHGAVFNPSAEDMLNGPWTKIAAGEKHSHTPPVVAYFPTSQDDNVVTRMSKMMPGNFFPEMPTLCYGRITAEGFEAQLIVVACAVPWSRRVLEQEQPEYELWAESITKH